MAYDVRGHGRSGKSDNPEDHQSSLYAADFDAVLKAFEVTKPLIVAWYVISISSTERKAQMFDTGAWEVRTI